MAVNLKNQIVEHLKRKGNYEDVDDMIIDILLTNIDYAEKLKVMIKNDGLQVTIPNGNNFITTKENPAFGTYLKCLDQIHTCSAKLGISRKDRITLKIIEEKAADEFDSDF